MQLSKIRIRNYRLLIDAELEVDPKTTLIVGRNNTAKTSCFVCIGNVLEAAIRAILFIPTRQVFKTSLFCLKLSANVMC